MRGGKYVSRILLVASEWLLAKTGDRKGHTSKCSKKKRGKPDRILTTTSKKGFFYNSVRRRIKCRPRPR